LTGSGGILPAAAAFGFVDSIVDWVGRVGYWAVFLVVAGDGVFPVLPGETSIITAAVVAADGRLNIVLVILAGALGAVVGDSCAYWIGRTGGGPIRAFVGKLAGRERLAAAERMVERQGPALVFVGRFLPGFRLGVNLSCGAGKMAYPRFLIWDSLGAIVWSTQAALLGYFLGKAFADQLWLAFLIAFGVAALVAAFVAGKEKLRLKRERSLAELEGAPLDSEEDPDRRRPEVETG
jgi:membrane protein DedA with SNARE-associated domain